MNRFLTVLLLLCFYVVGSYGQAQKNNSGKTIIFKEITDYLLKTRPKFKILINNL